MDIVREKLSKAVVGIAGLGGLGSNVAVALARTNIGKLIIADFDKVDQSNLNRQQYFTDQIGMSKVEALTVNLKRINPDVEIQGHRVRLNSENVAELFADCDVIAECFDKADAKQMIVETVLRKMPKVFIAAASGLAGYGRSNQIKTRRVNSRLVMVGDFESGIDKINILTAGRVAIAANHQANAIVEYLVDGKVEE
jgi:sulfur carrier protein ThiS adenylyltransferase